jgi:hypothetical protein
VATRTTAHLLRTRSRALMEKSRSTVEVDPDPAGSPGSRNRIASYPCPWHDAGP